MNTPEKVNLCSLRYSSKGRAHHRWLGLAMPFAVATALGAALVTVLSSEKFGLMFSLGLVVAVPVFLLVRDKEKLLWAMLLFFLPLNPMYRLIKPPVLDEAQMMLGAAHTLRFYFSDILLGLLCGIWLINIVMQKSRTGGSVWRTRLILPLILWLGMGVISIIPAVIPKLTAFELVAMGRMLLTFVVAFHYLKSSRDVRFVAKCLMVALLFQSMLLFAQFVTGSLLISTISMPSKPDIVGGIFRPSGGMDHSSHFAKWSGLVLWTSLGFGLFASRTRDKILGLSAWLCGTVALVMTVSRIGLGAWLISIMVLAAGLIRHRMITGRHVAWGAMLVCVCVVTGALVAGSNLQRRMEEEGSARSRIPMAQVAFNVIKAHPLLGVGLGNYILAAPDYDRTPQQISESFPSLVHDLFLAYAAKMRLIGLGFFLWLFWRLLRGAVRRAGYSGGVLDKAIYTGMAVRVVNILIQSMNRMGFRMHLVHMSTVSILAARVARVYRHFFQSQPERTKSVATLDSSVGYH